MSGVRPMKTRYLLAVIMVSMTGFGQGLKLKNGTFSEILNVPVRNGVINQIKVSNVPVSILDLDTLLKAGKFDPDEPYQQALTSRAPGAGDIFVILTVDVNKGFSIGRYDYVLRVEDKTVPIKAITMTGKPFDPRVWEIKAEDGVKTVDVLFEIPFPSGPVTALLQPKLDTTIPYGDVKLPVGRADGTAAGPADNKPAATQPDKKSPAVQPGKETSGDGVNWGEGAKEKESVKKSTKKVSTKKPTKKPVKKPTRKTEKPVKKNTGDDLDDLF